MTEKTLTVEQAREIARKVAEHMRDWCVEEGCHYHGFDKELERFLDGLMEEENATTKRN